MRCTVLTSSRSSGISGGLTYESTSDVQPGFPVRVPLRNAVVEGIVLDVLQEREKKEYSLKSITEVLGDKPLLSKAQIETLIWMAEKYHCSLRQAMRVWLPSPPWQSLLPQKEVTYSLLEYSEVRGAKQQAVIEYLTGKEYVSEKELKDETGVSGSTLTNLLNKKIIQKGERLSESSVYPSEKHISPPVLTPLQQEVADAIKKDKRPSLLFGITSSGKTEIYAHLIAETIQKGKQSLLLVPEILLTEHTIHRFDSLLPSSRTAVMHSRLKPSERREIWRRIHRGDIDLVIGSRSALFTPLQKLGLIIIDEEHEWTYKNEQTPRYHARETAEMLSKTSNAKLLLGSATPSLESWARTKDGIYHLTRLPERYGNHALPDVRIIDLTHVKFGSLYPFSPPLLEAIEDRLKRKEQSVLFLNRRGSASALLCFECRRRVVSPTSQLPFTVHTQRDGTPLLIDHTSGLTAPMPEKCPGCGSANLRAIGAGTQRIEEILKKRFPDAKLLRADSDTLKHPEDMRLMLETMRERRADILLGTQSVVKGLDLPSVTLAAVLIADIGLSLPHFRAGERIFQILTQLAGRSGRAQPGDVIIQTFRPDAPEVKLAAEHATEQYLEQELKLRNHLGYPPETEMIRFIFRGENVSLRAKAFAENFKNIKDTTASVAPTLFGGGTVWHVLLKGPRLRSLLKKIDCSYCTVDVDPMECV